MCTAAQTRLRAKSCMSSMMDNFFFFDGVGCVCATCGATSLTDVRLSWHKISFFSSLTKFDTAAADRQHFIGPCKV